MTRVGIVVRREFLERVRSKTFLIGTLAGPLILGAMMIVPALMADRIGEPLSVSVLDLGGGLKAAAETALAEVRQSGRARFEIRAVPTDTADARAELGRRVLAGELDGFVVLPAEVGELSEAQYFGRNVSNMSDLRLLERTLGDTLIRHRLLREGLDPGTLESGMRRLDLRTIRLSETGEREDRGAGFMFSIVLLMMIYTSTLMWGQALSNSVIEEKNNRIMEVMASSISPTEMLAGKLLGVGGAGLAQFLVWALAMVLAAVFGAAAAPDPSLLPEVTPLIVGGFVIFFLLGFFLYGSIYAAVGAMVNTQQEAQNLLMPVILPIVLGMTMFPVIMRDPDGWLAVALSLIPFLTPLLMFLRITVQAPPAWQIALSVALTTLTIAGMVWFAARIYRVGILMYGKRPTFPEILRWVRRS